jgi:hypothetical protein
LNGDPLKDKENIFIDTSWNRVVEEKLLRATLVQIAAKYNLPTPSASIRFGKSYTMIQA